jgi:tripartite ATP-independent transporter DctP family solute receptor
MKKFKITMLVALILSFYLLLIACDDSNSDINANGSETVETEETEETEETFDLEALKNGPETSLILGYSAPEGNAGDKACKEGAAALSEKTNGKFNITVYPAGQLGGDREEIEAVQLGDQDIFKGASSALVTFVPDLAIFDMPMVFSQYSREQVQKVLDGEVGDFSEKINIAFEKAGFKLLRIYSTDTYRTMSSNIPVHSIEDFNGIRIRTMENKYHMNFWNSLGASATPVNFAELYVALQQGMVDAQENVVSGLVASGQYEQVDYIMDTNHILFFNTLVMNNAKYDSLTITQKQLLEEYISYVVDKEVELTADENEAYAQQAKDYGIEFIELDDATISAMNERAKSTVDMISNDVGQDLVDSLFNSLEQAN